MAHFAIGANALAGMLKSAKAGNADRGSNSRGHENLLGGTDVITWGHQRDRYWSPLLCPPNESNGW